MKIIGADFLKSSYRLRLRYNECYQLDISAFLPFALDKLEHEQSDAVEKIRVWDFFNPYEAFSLFDEGWAKEKAEFLAYGKCYVQSGTKKESNFVLVQVGKVKKELLATGDRLINSWGIISRPDPFISMPITPLQTYGGLSCPSNKFGIGAEALVEADGESYWPVPNVTYPNQVMLSQSDILDPAGFWALPPGAPQRTKYLGKFDSRWLSTRWPEMPVETDPLYYQTAPTDQQFDGYLLGDEPIRITNMHPEKPVIETRLPGVRARIFVDQRIDGKLVFKELKANADTLWLFPDQMQGCLAFRSQVEVADRDGSDIEAGFCMLEQINQTPFSIEECYARYLSEASPVEEVISDVMGVETDEVIDEEEIQVDSLSKRQPGVPVKSSKERDQLDRSMNDWAISEMEKANVTPDDMEQFMNKADTKPQGSLLDLKKMIKQANEETLAVFKQTGTTDQDLIRMLRESPEAAATADTLANAPGGLAGLLSGLEDSIQQLFDLEKKMLNPDPNDPELVAAREAFEKEELERSAEEAAVEEPEETELIYDREWVVAHHAAGKSFRGYELERLDLSELNLSGADFSGAVLTKTDLTAALLNGVRFDDALLSEVIFNRANLSESSFRRVSASGSEFNEAHLQKANLRDADFTGAMFSGADLSQAILSGAICSGANFSGVRAERLVADKAEFADVNLTKANLVDARLTHIGFVGASLKGSDLSRANCLRADFSGADASDCNFRESLLQDSQADVKTTFSRSNFQKAILNEVSWDAPTLNQANFNEAQMDEADLTGARMLNVSMINVIARGAVFDKVDLERSDLTGSDMFEASFCDANLNSTRLQNGNYFAADFKGIKYEGASFEGSNIDRTILKIRQQ